MVIEYGGVARRYHTCTEDLNSILYYKGNLYYKGAPQVTKTKCTAPARLFMYLTGYCAMEVPAISRWPRHAEN
jgi:hypothetical protein